MKENELIAGDNAICTESEQVPEASPNTPLLLNVDQVASVLGISSRTVWRLHDSGQMPQCVRLGRSVR